MQNFVMVKQKLALTFWLSYDIHSAGLEGSDYTLLFQEQRELAPQWERPFLEEMRESLVVEFTQIFLEGYLNSSLFAALNFWIVHGLNQVVLCFLHHPLLQTTSSQMGSDSLS